MCESMKCLYMGPGYLKTQPKCAARKKTAGPVRKEGSVFRDIEECRFAAYLPRMGMSKLREMPVCPESHTQLRVEFL